MTYFYAPNKKRSYKVFIICNLYLFFITGMLSGQESLSVSLEEECFNCFSSEIVQISQVDDCIDIDLRVYTTGPCSHALSHMVVEVPCGTHNKIYISENWPVENYITDPSTGITGFKIDQINSFGSNSKIDTFYISYTVCSSDPECLSEINSVINLAYKAGNCVFSEELSNPNDPSIDVILKPGDVTCFDGSDGAVFSEVTGGEEPYSFEWSNGSTSADLLNVSAGIYTLLLTDALGNTVQKTAMVNQPAFPLSVKGEIIHASCNLYDGGINITATGGTSPYNFRWSNGDTAQELINAGQGSYKLIVTDAAGCKASKTFDIEENTDLEVSLTPNYLECYQEGEGEIVSTVTGGREPYEYSWSNGETRPDISGLNSGLYDLTVTDADGCAKTKSAYIGIKELSISANIQNPTCYGGDDGGISIVNVGYGTPPFSYLWNTGDTTETISGLSSGSYEITVTDSNECTVTKKLRVYDPRELQINYSVSPRNCSENSEAEINLTGSGGGGPYVFYLGDSLIGTNVILPGDGYYEIYMKDSNGCETNSTIHIESSDNINIISSIVQPSCTGLESGYASFSVNGGTDPYSFEWPDGTTGSSRSGLTPGNYTVNVFDANGCMASTSFTIDSINEVIAEIHNPEETLCNSDNNMMYATSTNATGHSWSIISADGNWPVGESSIDQLIYHAGNDSAKFI